MEVYTWRCMHGGVYMEVYAWRCIHGGVCMEVYAWRCMHGGAYVEGAYVEVVLGIFMEDHLAHNGRKHLRRKRITASL